MSDDRLTRPQSEMLEIARMRGWIRPSEANDLKVAKVLLRRGLLEHHPNYTSVLRPTERS